MFNAVYGWKMNYPRRTIRVFADYGNPWPIWETGGPNYTPEPADLGLSAALEWAMRNWYEFWLAHFHYAKGWDSSESAAYSATTGDDFVERLREEVAEFADVQDERYRGATNGRLT